MEKKSYFQNIAFLTDTYSYEVSWPAIHVKDCTGTIKMDYHFLSLCSIYDIGWHEYVYYDEIIITADPIYLGY